MYIQTQLKERQTDRQTETEKERETEGGNILKEEKQMKKQARKKERKKERKKGDGITVDLESLGPGSPQIKLRERKRVGGRERGGDDVLKEQRETNEQASKKEK